MPPRYSYWTILAGGLPTSFRAADREDLLPTLRRLQERHPDAEMRWFQRGKLWTSPEAARADFQKTDAGRGRDWRPGGEHRDPRDVFKKRARQRNQTRREKRFARKHDAARMDAPTGAAAQGSRSHARQRNEPGPRKTGRSGPRQKRREGRQR